MRTKRLFLSLIFVCLSIFPTVLFAQIDLTQTYTSPDGKFSMSYPADWTINDQRDDVTGFNGDGGFMQVSFYDNNTSGYAPVTALELLTVGIGEDTQMREALGFTEPEKLIIAGFPAVQSGSDMMGQLKTIIDFGDGVLGNLAGFAPEGQLAAFEPTFTAMMASIRYGDGPQPIIASPLDNLQPITPTNAVGVSSIMSLGDESIAVNTLAFSPDGKYLAVGSADGTVQIWNVADGKSQLVLGGHGNGVTSLAFGAGGYLLAVGTGSGDVRLWDTTTGEGSGYMQKHTSAVESVAFLMDGFLVASGAAEGGVQLWDVASRGAQAVLLDDNNPIPVASVTFSPDGATLAVGGGSSLQIWNVTTGSIQATLETQTSNISSLSFSPDGAWLAYGGANSSVWVWDLANDNHILRAGQTDSVIAIAFSPDGQTIASADVDALRLWDVSTGDTKIVLTAQTANSVAFSPDGTLLVSGGELGGVVLWGTTGSSESSSAAAPVSGSEATTTENTTTSLSACTITAPNNANLRSGPGTGFDRAGTLSAGQTADVDGQAQGADGMTWYRLSDSTWVRSDVIGAPAECQGVPDVTP